MKDHSMELAREGENLAANWLATHGYTVIERNYRYGHGEIDIIARNEEFTVFVEVKTRGAGSFGTAAAAVSSAKQRQLIHVARGYMYERNLGELSCRFDVITVDARGDTRTIEHFPHAFTEMP
jgi:putative endonuclease